MSTKLQRLEESMAQLDIEHQVGALMSYIAKFTPDEQCDKAKEWLESKHFSYQDRMLLKSAYHTLIHNQKEHHKYPSAEDIFGDGK